MGGACLRYRGESDLAMSIPPMPCGNSIGTVKKFRVASSVEVAEAENA